MINNEYKWTQDLSNINFKLEIGNSSNFDVIFYTIFVKIQVKNPGKTIIVDLNNEIDTDNLENNYYIKKDNYLEISCKKMNSEIWKQLGPCKTLNKSQILENRREAILKYEQKIKESETKKSQLNKQFNNTINEEQFKLNDLKKKNIEDIKKAEYDTAINNIYEKENYNKVEYINDQTYKPVRNYDKDAEAIKINFTEKVFPNVALRETHYFETPKPKKNEKTDKNYLYLKDKGDEFFKNGDLISAEQAYTESLRLNNKYLNCLFNRSILYFHNLDDINCLNDINMIEDNYSKLENNEKYHFLNIYIYLVSIIRKGHIYLIKGDLEKSLYYFETVLQKYDNLENDIIDKVNTNQLNEIVENIKNDIEVITVKLSLTDIKNKADQLFNDNKYVESKELYIEIINKDDKNIIALSNISFIEYLLKDYHICIKYSDKVLELLLDFENNYGFKITENNKNKSLLILKNKNIYKISKSLYKLKDYNKALEIIKEIIKIDINNKEAIQLRNKIKDKINLQNALSLKKSANDYLLNSNYETALNELTQILKLVKPNFDFELYLSVLLNKTVCNISLNKHNDVVNDCIKGINIINNIETNYYLKKYTKSLNNNKIFEIKKRFYFRIINSYIELKL
jgi:dyslexia susceptibility 1 candidate gene 1 protein